MARTLSISDLPPAPGESAHSSLALANSGGWGVDGQIVDLLGDPVATTRWMIDRGLAAHGAEVQEYCSNRLRTFRDAVRSVLAAAVEGQPPPRTAVEAVNVAMKLAPAVDMLVWGEASRRFETVPEHPATRTVEYAMSSIAADLMALVVGEDCAKLACCEAPSCERYLVRTHARRHWCSTRCGDRVRAARAYARKVKPQ